MEGWAYLGFGVCGGCAVEYLGIQESSPFSLLLQKVAAVSPETQITVTRWSSFGGKAKANSRKLSVSGIERARTHPCSQHSLGDLHAQKKIPF